MSIFNNKRFLCLLLALLLVVATACMAAPAPKEPKTLRLWHYYNGPQQDAFNALVQQFNETVGQAQGILVEASGMGNVTQTAQAVLDAANKNAGAQGIPNIFAAYADTALAIDQLGLVASLDSYLSAEELANYIPGYLDEGRFDSNGTLKIFPIAKSTEIMSLNKTTWDEFAAATGASIDALATIEGVTKTAEQYYAWSDGQAFFGRDAMANYMLIGSMQLGKPVLSIQNGRCDITLDNTTLRRLWDNFYLPYIKGHFVHYGKFRTDDIKTGALIAGVCSTSGVSYFPKQVQSDNNVAVDIEMLVLPAPLFEGAAPYAVQQGAGMVVTKSDAETERACVEFLRWFTAPEQNVAFALTSGYMPVTKNSSSVEAMRSFSAAHPEAKISAGMTQALEVSLAITQTHEMYSPKAFDGGNAARRVLETSLIDKAQADRKQVDELVAAGTPANEAVAQFNTDANFQLWLDELGAQLKTAIFG